MSYTSNKSGNDSKSHTLGSMNRQNVIQETNKKRTLLTDNSWIKRRPEDEGEKIKDENFGKSVLNRYKSQDDLDRDYNKEDRKPIHNRFKSDDALDRISQRNPSEKGNKAATLEREPMSSGTEPSNKSRQSWAPSSKITTTTTTEESKRKSWGPTNRNTITTTTSTTTDTKQDIPGKQDGQRITIYSSDSRGMEKQPRTNFIDSARSRFEKTEDKPSPPISPIAKTDTRPSYPAKPVIPEGGERRSAMERKQRNQDLDNLIGVSNSRGVSSKGTQDVDSLIDIKAMPEKSKKRDQVDDLIQISNTAKNTCRREDELDNLIEIKKPEVKSRNGDLNNLIEIKKPEVKTRTENLDNLIDIKGSTTSENKGSQDLDDLIAITGDGKRGILKNSSTSGNVSSRSPATTTYTVNDDSLDAPSRRSTTTTIYTVNEDAQNAPSRRSTTATTYKVTEGNSGNSTRGSVPSYHDTTDGSNHSNTYYSNDRSYVSSSTYLPPYEVSKSNNKSYGENVKSNSIDTVYSTSDRSVIQKDICTYCRKPLGIEAKMILKDLSIQCHATCFKCEACSGPLGNLKAGDSMWIYKQTIHCEPCYFAAREKWII